MDLHALGQQALALHRQGRLQEAESRYRQILSVNPAVFPALSLLGLICLERGNSAEAVELLGRALAINPGDVVARMNYGTALLGQSRFAEALANFDQLLGQRPDQLAAVSGRAAALRALGQSEAALKEYTRLIAADPDNADAWNMRGALLRDMRHLKEALASFDRAIALRPDFAWALQNRGELQWNERLDYDGALSDFSRALALEPERPWLRGNLLHLKMFGADWSGFDEEVQSIDQGVQQGKAVIHPFIYQAISHDPAALQKSSRIYTQSTFPSRRNCLPDWGARTHDKIRLGYLSGEFRAQAVGYLMVGLYECHDRTQFEVIALDNGYDDQSPTRARLEKAFDRFVPVTHLSDQEAVAQINRLEIDILVNLNGHFGAPRTQLFAMRSAPIQVSYMGFPATMGAPYIDYILADRVVIPENEQQFYDEKIAWLPGSYWVNDSKRPIAAQIPSRSDCGLPQDAVVFCNFNSSYKLTPSCFRLWMQILKQVPESVLWMFESNNKRFAENIRRAAMDEGVKAERIVFAPLIASEQHLARLKLADLSLDSLPYNAHTTAADILWAGVPFLTCRGSTWPGRVATSMLLAMDLAELVTENTRDYLSRAVELAKNRDRLSAIRAEVAANRFTTALFDTERSCRYMERAYHTMWRRHREGGAPESFCVNVGA